ncbi:MAG: tRNA 4-thiouridine(8) synthase ThiI [Actinomycetota bacterium]
MNVTKAVALLSGGLDSMLAVKVIQEHGIQVVGVSFVTPFFSAKMAKEAAKQLSIPLHIFDITHEHLEIVKRPKYGYGKYMNPCIDCHAFMVKKAGEFMEQIGASFIVSGEVLGERPKSQNRMALRIVEKESGYRGYLLRPLSAKLLPPTVPEEKGLVDKERLLSIQGRSRKPQLELAERYGFKDFPTPAGGCLLTDPIFSQRLRDLLAEKKDPTINDLELLKLGRHFCSPEGVKIVVARNQRESELFLKLTQPEDWIFQVKGYPGPRTLVRGKNVGEQTIKEAAILTARYSKARNLPRVKVGYRGVGEEEKIIEVEHPLKSLSMGSINEAKPYPNSKCKV